MWCDIGATLSGDGIVTVIKASGNGSLKFTIPAGSVGAAAGNFAMNFSRDMSVQFGEGRSSMCRGHVAHSGLR